MRKILLFPCLVTLLSCLTCQTRGSGTLVQFSTINALLQGVYEGPTSFADLKKYGDFGIGTLNSLDGEMITLEGKSYQITSDGKTHPIPDSGHTPFATVTFFHPDEKFTVEPSAIYIQLQELLDRRLPSKNYFYALRIKGTFSNLKVRSVPRQSPPYRDLKEVSKSQTVFQWKDIRGTLIGFRCPAFAKGFNVPGYHFHFISENRDCGGHVLDCALASGDVSVDTLEKIQVLLPANEAFANAKLDQYDDISMQAVEKQTTPAR